MDIYELIDVEIKKVILNTQDHDLTELQRLLDTVYNKIYESKNSDITRDYINKLSKTFHAVGDNTVVILAFILMNKLSDINGIKILSELPNDTEPETGLILDFIKSEIINNNGQINFFNHKKGSTTLGKKKIICHNFYYV